MSNIMGWDGIQIALFSVASVCLTEWSVYHFVEAARIIAPAWVGNPGGSLKVLYSMVTGVDYESYSYPVHTSRIFIQHAINVAIAAGFAQLATVVMMFNSKDANLVALLPFLFDVGYFISADLPELGSWI
jgi:hypothetical protein